MAPVNKGADALKLLPALSGTTQVHANVLKSKLCKVCICAYVPGFHLKHKKH